MAVSDAGIAKIPPKHMHVRLISDSKLTLCVSTVIRRQSDQDVPHLSQLKEALTTQTELKEY